MLICLTLSATSYGKLVSKSEAMRFAQDFVTKQQCGSQEKSRINAPDNSKLQCVSESASGAYYVFNLPTTGYVIVAADDRIPVKVLGYSFDSRWDPSKMPVQLEALLENFEAQILSGKIKRNEMIPTSTGNAVAPLLGNIEWNQYHPYNLLCPPAPDGSHSATGCVNTAIAQIMKYHEWPVQPEGFLSYTLANGEICQTDLSSHSYDWNLIAPQYDNSSSMDSQLAVAQLMYDCGVANSTSYGYASGATLSETRLVDNFKYDKSIRYQERNYCSREYWENLIRREIDEGRPVSYGGGSPHGAHEFVCDGYDSDGYFHFNFGWGGYNNGYFLTTATGYDSSPGMTFNIAPEHGGQPQLEFRTTEDFIHDGSSFKCDMDVRVVYDQPGVITAALKIENIDSGEIIYRPYISIPDILYYTFHEIPDVTVGEIADGSYKVSFAARYNDEEWSDAPFPADRQTFVDMNVTNGVVTFDNTHIVDRIDDGTYLVDGIYYTILTDDEVSVTYRNDRYESYHEDVTIPDWVQIEGKDYKVTSIGNSAFHKCPSLGVVTIGRNVEIIGSSFTFSRIKEIKFAEGSGLKSVGGWAFNASTVENMVFPYGLEQIQLCAFQSTTISEVNIPRSVTYLSYHTFNYTKNLKKLILDWSTDEEILKFAEEAASPFQGIDCASIELSVPKGTYPLYSSKLIWQDFNIIERSDDSVESCETGKAGFLMDGNVIRAHSKCSIHSIDGLSVGSLEPEETLTLRKGIYIIMSGNAVYKITVKH